nr:serine/threonine-protein phosphatase 2a activator 2 [Quercus suber]
MPSAIPIPRPPPSSALPRLTPRRRPLAEEHPPNPPPQTPHLPAPPSLSDHVFSTPTRRILSDQDHVSFLRSDTHDLIVGFVFSLADSVVNKTISSVTPPRIASDATVDTILAILQEASELLESFPPLDTGSRFGNPAFRDFLGGVKEAQCEWHERLGVRRDDAIAELSTYLLNSFGNGTRIDYGSGHELNFILWLLCLRQIAVFNDASFPVLTLRVFPRYLRLMRDVQSAYYLEPAGSHGVWGLDDYQFLPFLFGASQLLNHEHIRPLSIHNELIIEECSKDYLYLDQIRWVNSTKTVQGLRWHSPMLDDISSAKSWVKVEAGMRRMFLAEVLGKLPVAQHFMFGSLLRPSAVMSQDAQSHLGEEDVGKVEITVDGMKHKHNPNSWGDCCGIKVPSAVGATQEAKKSVESPCLSEANFMRFAKTAIAASVTEIQEIVTFAKRNAKSNYEISPELWQLLVGRAIAVWRFQERVVMSFVSKPITMLARDPVRFATITIRHDDFEEMKLWPGCRHRHGIRDLDADREAADIGTQTMIPIEYMETNGQFVLLDWRQNMLRWCSGHCRC